MRFISTSLLFTCIILISTLGISLQSDNPGSSASRRYKLLTKQDPNSKVKTWMFFTDNAKLEQIFNENELEKIRSYSKAEIVTYPMEMYKSMKKELDPHSWKELEENKGKENKHD